MLGTLLTNIDLDPVVKDGAIVVLEGLAGGTFIYVKNAFIRLAKILGDVLRGSSPRKSKRSFQSHTVKRDSCRIFGHSRTSIK